jgi:phage tail sheath protein FI
MAKRFKTPGVFNTEIDLSEITAPTGTSVGGIVIRSTKGPINRMVTVTSDKDFIDTFGEPVFTSGSGTDTLNKKIPEYGYGAYSALEFLNESDTLNVLRVPNSGDSFAEATISVTGDFVGGAVNQGNGLTSTDGWNHFAEKENVDVDILIVPTYSQTVKQYVANNVVANRKDCIMVAQSGNVNQTSVSDILTSETYGYTSPSYVALYAGWDQIYDSYNDVKVFVPKCIFGASVMARTDTVANVWDAPAGTDRGVINAIDQNKVYTETEIGLLYDKNINTSKLIRGVGHVLWGQKTAQLKKSALDRINVRRNLLFIEKTIERSLQVYVLNVNNNESTRLRVFSNLDSFLATVRSRGGLIAYQVVESNNTSTVIDNNQLAVDVYVQPAKTVEFIDLQTIVTRTGVNFAEVVA